MTDLINKAKEMAKRFHDAKGQVGYFESHVLRCYEIAVAYLMSHCPDTRKSFFEKHPYTAIDMNKFREYAEWLNEHELCVILLHDVLEDTDATYDEISEVFGFNIADDVFNVTDEDGINRKERKLKTYWKIRRSNVSRFAKMVDRLANVEQSVLGIEKDRSYLNMYMKEYYAFKCALWQGPLDDYNSLWDMLDKLHGFKFK